MFVCVRESGVPHRTDQAPTIWNTRVSCVCVCLTVGWVEGGERRLLLFHFYLVCNADEAPATKTTHWLTNPRGNPQKRQNTTGIHLSMNIQKFNSGVGFLPPCPHHSLRVAYRFTTHKAALLEQQKHIQSAVFVWRRCVPSHWVNHSTISSFFSLQWMCAAACRREPWFMSFSSSTPSFCFTSPAPETLDDSAPLSFLSS